jgi:hypothetical protein
VKLYEAVALSLNLAPEKLRRNPRPGVAGSSTKRRTSGSAFVAQRNLGTLGYLNFGGVRCDETPR